MKIYDEYKDKCEACGFWTVTTMTHVNDRMVHKCSSCSYEVEALWKSDDLKKWPATKKQVEESYKLIPKLKNLTKGERIKIESNDILPGLNKYLN